MRVYLYTAAVVTVLILTIVWALDSETIEDRGGIFQADGQRYSDPGPAVQEEIASCAVCHQLNATDPPRSAPSLHRIIGAPRASSAWFGYSPALARKGGEWSRESLDEYLADPLGYLPGTSKTLSRVIDEGHRQRILDALAALDSQ